MRESPARCGRLGRSVLCVQHGIRTSKQIFTLCYTVIGSSHHTHTQTHTHLFAVANLLVGYPVHTQRDYRHENGPEQLWTIRLKVQHC